MLEYKIKNKTITGHISGAVLFYVENLSAPLLCSIAHVYLEVTLFPPAAANLPNCYPPPGGYCFAFRSLKPPTLRASVSSMF